LCAFASLSSARDRWKEFNIGPFFVATEGDETAARDALTQLEQLRWVLGGLLEARSLNAVWPMRVLLSDSAKANATTAGTEFVLQNGQYVLLTAPGSHLPLGQVAGILIEANTPRMPAEVESGLQQLFDSLEAHGSRVSWGGTPAHADLAWARVQLFATRFEYGTSFHIFLNALKGGSTVRAAERNAFGRDGEALEREAAANLARGGWEPVSVSGRPLDPKRDFGEHPLDSNLAAVYLADAQLSVNPQSAAAAYRSAVAAGGALAALGYEGLAQVARFERKDPQPFLQQAIEAGSKSPPVFLAAALDLPENEALPLLKKASELNPLWAEPVFRQAQFISDLTAKETLIRKATQLDPRISEYWIELARTQTENGHAAFAQGSWLRAEDSARNEAERMRIHQLRMDSEQHRLDAADADRRREREAVHQADQRAQESQSDRIRAAEEKANLANDMAAGAPSPDEVVPWNATVPKRKFQGLLLQVECLRTGARLSVKNRAGQTLFLFLPDIAPLQLSCGAQKVPRRVSLSYLARPDEVRHTAGEVAEIAWQ
jgi:hypothetical protein